jgi:hypothetical protein
MNTVKIKDVNTDTNVLMDEELDAASGGWAVVASLALAFTGGSSSGGGSSARHRDWIH